MLLFSGLGAFAELRDFSTPTSMCAVVSCHVRTVFESTAELLCFICLLDCGHVVCFSRGVVRFCAEECPCLNHLMIMLFFGLSLCIYCLFYHTIVFCVVTWSLVTLYWDTVAVMFTYLRIRARIGNFGLVRSYCSYLCVIFLTKQYHTSGSVPNFYCSRKGTT